MTGEMDWPTSPFSQDESATNVKQGEQGAGLSHNTSIEERILLVLESVKSAGFDNIEALLSTYYLSDFAKNPNLSNIQRMSRKRRLPGFLSSLAEDMQTWTSWEAEGCREELVKSAETVLLIEYRAATKKRDLLESLTSRLRLEEEDSAMDGGVTQGTVAYGLSEVGRLFRDEVVTNYRLDFVLFTLIHG